MPAKKSSAEKRVAVIFSLSTKIRDELNKKIPTGYRSQFVEKLLEREFSKVATEKKAVTKKTLLARLFQK